MAADGWTLRFLEANARPWTGVQVKSDPGVWVVWIGCALILMGCWMSFFMTHMNVWIRVRGEGGMTQCEVAVSSQRKTKGIKEKVGRVLRVFERKAGWKVMQGGSEDG